MADESADTGRRTRSKGTPVIGSPTVSTVAVEPRLPSEGDLAVIMKYLTEEAKGDAVKTVEHFRQQGIIVHIQPAEVVSEQVSHNLEAGEQGKNVFKSVMVSSNSV